MAKLYQTSVPAFPRSAELNEGTLLRANLFGRGVATSDTGVHAIVTAEQDESIEPLGDCVCALKEIKFIQKNHKDLI